MFFLHFTCCQCKPVSFAFIILICFFALCFPSTYFLPLHVPVHFVKLDQPYQHIIAPAKYPCTYVILNVSWHLMTRNSKYIHEVLLPIILSFPYNRERKYFVTCSTLLCFMCLHPTTRVKLMLLFSMCKYWLLSLIIMDDGKHMPNMWKKSVKSLLFNIM